MAEIKVSQLPEASEINDNDLLMIVQSGTNKKITKANARFASGDEIYVGDSEPTGDDADSVKLWLSDDDALVGEGSYISNTYGTSQEIGYSQEYSNPIVLWENESPTSDFAGQTIQLSSSNYNYYEIYCKYYKTQDVLIYTKSIKGMGTAIYLGDTYSGLQGGQSKRRRFIYTDATHLNVENCLIQSGTTETTENSFIIPLKVIGYK